MPQISPITWTVVVLATLAVSLLILATLKENNVPYLSNFVNTHTNKEHTNNW